jgi:hypothetical protein
VQCEMPIIFIFCSLYFCSMMTRSALYPSPYWLGAWSRHLKFYVTWLDSLALDYMVVWLKICGSMVLG